MKIDNKYTVIGGEGFGLLNCNLETKKETLFFDTEQAYVSCCADKGIMIPQLMPEPEIEDVEEEIL